MSHQLQIQLPKVAYQPGETIQGTLRWNLPKAPGAIEITLGWWTTGKGTQDSKIEAELEFPASGYTGTHNFQLKIPLSPHSFEGHLISLKWALEARTSAGKNTQNIDLVVSPHGTPVALPFIADESKRKSLSFRSRR